MKFVSSILESRYFILIATIIGVLARVFLALINRESNDDHMEVIQLLRSGVIPDPLSCWECFQPLLYHQTCALCLDLFNISSATASIVFCQLLNVIAGIFTLLICYRTLGMFGFNGAVIRSSFLLLAWNPKLISINAMVTNDSFVILFGSMAVFFALRFLVREWSPKDGIWCVLSIVLACCTKGNGLPLLSLVPVILVKVIHVKKQSLVLALTASVVATILVLAAVWLMGPYSGHFDQKGDAFITNREKCDPPTWIEADTCGRPGIRSISEGYFSFPLISLIKEPYNTSTIDSFALHRTCLWTQLYAGMWSVHFDRFPFSWVNESPRIVAFNRVQMAAGLVPFFILLAGCFYTFRSLAIQEKRRFPDPKDISFRLCVILQIPVYLAFLVAYSYNYRDFSCMKTIFIFPVLPAFLVVFAHGIQKLPLQILLVTITCLVSLLGITEIAYLLRGLLLLHP